MYFPDRGCVRTLRTLYVCMRHCYQERKSGVLYQIWGLLTPLGGCRKLPELALDLHSSRALNIRGRTYA